jgi:acyl-CoA hydrolase/RimJ/RimL family protein N-acetyltransferase
MDAKVTKAQLSQKLSAIGKNLTTAEDALASVRSGDRVFVGTACAAPKTLIAGLENRATYLDHVQLVYFLTSGLPLEFDEGSSGTKFKHKVFFVGTDAKEAIKRGKADYIPISLAQVPRLIETGRMPIDVALIQVSSPDKNGFVSLGISVDITRQAVLKARTVIAEVNPNMPFTLGDTLIPLERIEHLTYVDAPVTEYIHDPVDSVAEQIARYVARIIDDGATLQIGLGQIPNEMLKYLTNRRNLGIHSDVITDPIVHLVENGIITGSQKSINEGKVVASYCIGTNRLYELIDENPAFSFHPIDYVANAAVIAENNKMVSVTQAFAIDLMGQVCSDQFEGEFYSGVSTQPDFIRGAANSSGGKPIICLASTTPNGSKSRIRPLLLEGEGVTIARSDVHYVVTEYGYAYLFGKSIRDRALALIEIAHPSFRKWLLDEGKRLGYLHQNQVLKSVVAYPTEEERNVKLKDGEEITIRPSKASDLEGLQDLFYHMRPEDIYTRFFSRMKSLSISMAQHLCNVDYDSEMAFMAVTGEAEDEQIIGSACYFVDQSANMAEVAYMIRAEWQGKGLGIALQKRITEYAKSKGLLGFTMDILADNTKMKRLVQRENNVSINLSDGVYEVAVKFE